MIDELCVCVCIQWPVVVLATHHTRWLALQLSSGKAKLLVSHVKLCVVDSNENFPQNPDIIGSWSTQEPTDTLLPALGVHILCVCVCVCVCVERQE